MIFVLRTLEGRCYGKQLNVRANSMRINGGDDSATSCKNLVNFGPVSPEITRLESQNAQSSRSNRLVKVRSLCGGTAMYRVDYFFYFAIFR